MHLFSKGNDKKVLKVKAAQNLKLTSLIGQQTAHDPNQIIFNYSSYQLNDIEQSLLCKGLNYALPPKKLKYEDYLMPFEILYRNVRDDDNASAEKLVYLRTKLSHIAVSSLRAYNRIDHRFENISKEEHEAFIKLASNDNIIIQKSDKGNSVVIVDKKTYIRKMELLLSDKTKFRKVVFNPKFKVNKDLIHILEMEGEIRTILQELVDDQYLSKQDYDFLKPIGSRPGILYGLCKVHKTVVDESPLFVLSYRPSVPVVITWPNFLSQYYPNIHQINIL